MRGNGTFAAPRWKVSDLPQRGHPLARAPGRCTLLRPWRAFCLVRGNLTGVHVSEELATDARTDSERRGITIGILVVALLCLSLFFVWHHYGVPGSGARPAVGSAQ